MNKEEQNRISKLLQQALPKIEGDPEPDRNLWPRLQQRIGSGQAVRLPSHWSWRQWGWFDWALLAGVCGFAGFLPALIPVLLYAL